MHRIAIKKYALIFVAVLLLDALFVGGGLNGQSKDSNAAAFKLLKRLDKNQDGFLTADEIPARSRAAIANVAKDAGVKINARKGVSIEKLQKQLKKKRKVEKSDDEKKTSKEKNKDDKKARKQGKIKAADKQSKLPSDAIDKVTDDEKSNNTKSTPKSFGKAEVTVSTKGFGKPSTSNDKGATDKADRDTDSKTTDKKKPKKDKYARYAASLMRRHDKNDSGMLEKNEWQKLKGPTKEYDLNGDDALDEMELRAKLVGFSTGPSNSTSSLADNQKPIAAKKRKRRKARANVKRDADGTPRSYRFKTAHERVLGKLPDADWFVRLDRNKDGQIAMSEFARTWNASKVSEFMEKDINNDGIITPDELQEAQE